MWVLFINLPVVFLNHLFKIINLFVQLSYLFLLYLSQCLTLYQTVFTTVPSVSSAGIPTATFPSHIPNTYYTNASIRSVSSKLITTSTLKFYLSSHPINVIPKTFRTPIQHNKKSIHLLPLLSLFNHHIKKKLVLPLLQHFLFHRIIAVATLLQFLVPFYLPII